MTFLIFLKNGQVMDLKSSENLISSFSEYHKKFREMKNIDILENYNGKKERFKISQELDNFIFLDNFCLNFEEVLAIREINKDIETSVLMEEKEKGGILQIASGEEKMIHFFRNDEELKEFLQNFSDESLAAALNR